MHVRHAQTQIETALIMSCMNTDNLNLVNGIYNPIDLEGSITGSCTVGISDWKMLWYKLAEYCCYLW